MNISPATTLKQDSLDGKGSRPLREIAGKAGVVVLRTIELLTALLLVLPVALLPLVTSVPTPVVILLLAGDVLLVVGLFRMRRARRTIEAALVGFSLVALVAVLASQWFANTPPILGDNGAPLPGSIATLERVNLNGSEQWITIRGKSVDNPVLLYLGIGGPGAGGFPASPMTLKPLEDHFVVVNWDQPGTGKSYDAVPISTLTVHRFVEDARALTDILRTRFHQDKIYVVGLSWGTILGTMLVHEYPDRFYAYVGSGQMVNTTENDRIGYDLAVQIATERGNTATVEALHRNGPPPYAGDGLSWKYASYNNVLFEYMGSLRLEMVMVLVPQFAREYGYVDKVNFARGLVDEFTVLYPQLRDLDFTTQAEQIGVPMYFLVGRHDVNAVTSLVDRYYNVLQAPYKELIWLESAHGAGAEEYHDALVNHVLVRSAPQAAR